MCQIFCYHGLVPSKIDFRLERNFHTIKDFQHHVQLLRWMKPISLDHALSRNGRFPVFVTFDDGYKNNLIVAEILSRHKIPWALFVTTDALGRENSIWTVELSLLLLHGNATGIDILERKWTLSTRQERETAFQTIRYAMKAVPAVERVVIMQNIRGQFPAGETQRLLEKFPSMQMLTWEEVRQLSNAGVVVGSHGYRHEIHHRDQPSDTRWEELTLSKYKIEEQLGHSCDAFAYPNGDFNDNSPNELRDAGYKYGFTLQSATVNRNTNPWLLPRLDPPSALIKYAKTFICS
jgi:peptidoglycan/xylan/chitin deacetylase (PgdA/CDA1 family)